MKKKFILMLTLLAGVLSANADNVVSIGGAYVQKSGEGVIVINLNNDEIISSFQFDVTLPDGVSFVMDGDAPVAEPTSRLGNLDVSSSLQDEHTARFLSADLKGGHLNGNSGPIFCVKVTTTLESGEVAAKLSGIVLSKEGIKETPEDIDFNVNVFDGVILHEENTKKIAKQSGVNVKVLRTIEAGEWSTICLPFDMDEDQVKAAFGDDVELKEFVSAEATTDAISIKFKDADEFAKHTPYLIKVSSDITEFTVNDVDIAKEADIETEDDNENLFIGTYRAQTIDEEGVFISGNKFWYSAGKTKIRAFRCWFEFDETLDAYDGSRSIEYDFIDGTTGINNAVRQLPNDGNYYNLKGQRVDKPSKGVFIVNGKKVVVK